MPGWNQLCRWNEIRPYLPTQSDFITKWFHPTEVGFIPSVRTDLVEKNPHLSTTNVGSFLVRATGLELHFSFPMKKKNIGRTQCAHWVQQPATGRLHINGFESFTIPTNEGGRWAPLFCCLKVTKRSRIEVRVRKSTPRFSMKSRKRDEIRAMLGWNLLCRWN